MISTTEDMFPFEGARKSFEEAKRIYGIYGAADNLQWIVGPGRHANLRPIHPEIIKFFLHQLRQSDRSAQTDPTGRTSRHRTSMHRHWPGFHDLLR